MTRSTSGVFGDALLMISFLGGFYCRNIRATGSRSQLEVSPRGRRSVSETSSVEEKTEVRQPWMDGWKEGRDQLAGAER